MNDNTWHLDIYAWDIYISCLKPNGYNIKITENFSPVEDIDLYVENIETAKRESIRLLKKYLNDYKNKIDDCLDKLENINY